MSKGNPSKRKGTANERQLLHKLWLLDPDGKWQSRTTVPDGSRRPTPPTHGWDVWSDERKTYIEAKVRTGRITVKQIREWCQQHEHAIERQSVVVYRRAGSGEWMAAGVVGSMLYMHPLEDYIEMTIEMIDGGLI